MYRCIVIHNAYKRLPAGGMRSRVRGKVDFQTGGHRMQRKNTPSRGLERGQGMKTPLRGKDGPRLRGDAEITKLAGDDLETCDFVPTGTYRREELYGEDGR